MSNAGKTLHQLAADGYVMVSGVLTTLPTGTTTVTGSVDSTPVGVTNVSGTIDATIIGTPAVTSTEQSPELVGIPSGLMANAGLTISGVITELTAGLATWSHTAIQNSGSVNLFVGGSAVTAADGWIVASGEEFSYAGKNISWYGVTENNANEVNVRVIQLG